MPKKPAVLDAKRIALSGVVGLAKKRFILRYMYECKEGEWEHEVALLPHPGRGKLAAMPFCADGAMACPLEEDTHGPEDFMELKRQLNSKCGEERKEWSEWLSKVRPLYDFNHFDPEEATKNMRRVHRGKP